MTEFGPLIVTDSIGYPPTVHVNVAVLPSSIFRLVEGIVAVGSPVEVNTS